MNDEGDSSKLSDEELVGHFAFLSRQLAIAAKASKHQSKHSRRLLKKMRHTGNQIKKRGDALTKLLVPLLAPAPAGSVSEQEIAALRVDVARALKRYRPDLARATLEDVAANGPAGPKQSAYLTLVLWDKDERL